jgi:hypothetical protein
MNSGTREDISCFINDTCLKLLLYLGQNLFLLMLFMGSILDANVTWPNGSQDNFIVFHAFAFITRVIDDINIVKYWCIMLQHSLNMSSPSNKSSYDTLSHHNHVESSSCHTQGRPRAGSESSSGRGAVSKVMDMFRHRSHSAVSAEDKRKAVSRLVYFTNS